MTHQNPSDDQLRELLTRSTTLAMVGASNDPSKPSHGMMKRMRALGFKVYPVNPNEAEVLGEKAYASLAALPEKIDIVDVFRRPEHTPAIADEAVAIGARALWLQSGIVNEEAAARAEAGGLRVVMDRCIGVECAMLRIPPKTPSP